MRRKKVGKIERLAKTQSLFNKSEMYNEQHTSSTTEISNQGAQESGANKRGGKIYTTTTTNTNRSISNISMLNPKRPPNIANIAYEHNTQQPRSTQNIVKEAYAPKGPIMKNRMSSSKGDSPQLHSTLCTRLGFESKDASKPISSMLGNSSLPSFAQQQLPKAKDLIPKYMGRRGYPGTHLKSSQGINLDSTSDNQRTLSGGPLPKFPDSHHYPYVSNFTRDGLHLYDDLPHINDINIFLRHITEVPKIYRDRILEKKIWSMSTIITNLSNILYIYIYIYYRGEITQLHPNFIRTRREDGIGHSN